MPASVSEADVAYGTLPDFDGYKFGTDGSIWSQWRKYGKGRGKGGGWRAEPGVWRKMNPTINQGGYHQVGLRRTEGGIIRSVLVHQLILLAFGFARPSPSHQVCHWDGVRTNNKLSNLRWGTVKENAADSVRHGTRKRVVNVCSRLEHRAYMSNGGPVLALRNAVA